ncbi:glycylpeptide N-tetradecanoyltransferase [Polytolypa hystricis UAMH7299]|uniref:Glycylpeptide N-tetradecanoyltransferase n=1 Tax=Polytolypa hystricis (strain UAMH7299) TaxID=1447883 RepID=A0A2B7XXW3_POLH7|nr:glycylpeptide N-tetradecanoyltransferase [Polytolypa hystricis UAMH7299]
MSEPDDKKSAGLASDANESPVTAPEGAETASAGCKTSEESKKSKDEDAAEKKPGAKLSDDAVASLLEMNPALRGEVAGMDKEKAAELVRKLDISQLLTGLSVGTKNQKDMASYKFWQTQPVSRFDDKGKIEDGPIKQIDPDKVSKEPEQLVEGFEWTTLDITDENELRELYELLNGHYVEDNNAMFRFNYSATFLNWALKSPGWRKEWHVGVRATRSRKLVASICGVPAEIAVRGQSLKVVEINFLCVHKKLRSKRLTPVLIKEITRRCYLSDIFQAIYTVGNVLPTPVSSCRYYHRSLNWLKLYEVGFSPLPHGSTKARQISKSFLPGETSTPGLRPMQTKDVDAVHDLVNRYLQRFELSQNLSRKEIDHFMLQKDRSDAEQVVWAYVVEEPVTHKITDFVSFYCLESTVINNDKHDNIKAAYLYYYASETAFAEKEKGLKERLQTVMNDGLILAKKAGFDVFNALTLHDNPLFLEALKFGPGDGQLYYYLFNYRTAQISGGVNEKNLPDERKRGGVGVVLF